MPERTWAGAEPLSLTRKGGQGQGEKAKSPVGLP